MSWLQNAVKRIKRVILQKKLNSLLERQNYIDKQLLAFEEEATWARNVHQTLTNELAAQRTTIRTKLSRL